MNIWVAIVMNLAGFVMAIGTATTAIVSAYIMFQNWKAARKHAELVATVNNMAGALGVSPVGDKHEPLVP